MIDTPARAPSGASTVQTILAAAAFAVALLFAPQCVQADGPSAVTSHAFADADRDDRGIDGAERVEIGLTEPVGFRAFTLNAPPRVIFEFPALTWRMRQPQLADDLEMIAGFRFLEDGDAARLVIDLAGPARVAQAYTDVGGASGAAARLVIDLVPESEATFARDAANAAEIAALEQAGADPPPPWPRPRRGILVAIDPGHGGADPGASSEGVDEKDLVLDYARAVKAVIDERRGFRAMLVRKGDEFLRLRERVARAREAGADVLVSLHADALESGVASGASVFTLSEKASSKEAAALAASHDRADRIGGVAFDETESDVARVLIDFSQRRTNAASEDLAREVVAALKERTKVLKGRELQSAGFRVLKAPDMPSILIELGFMSSERDRARLTSPETRAAVAEAVAEGVFVWAERRAAREASE